MLTDSRDKALVLALHGSASSGRQWRSLAKKLIGTHAVLAPDMPGYGAMPAQDRRAFFKNLVDKTPGDLDIVGHSFGCSVALYLANAMPERIKSVVLYDPVVPVEHGGGFLAPDLEVLWQGVKDADAETAMQMFIDYWTGRNRWQCLSGPHQSRLLEQFASVALDFQEGAAGYWSVGETRYRGPLTIFTGALSPKSISQASAYLERCYAGVSVNVVPDMGHMAPLTDYELTDELFCQSLRRGRRPLLAA